MALGFHVGVKSKLPHVHIALEYATQRARPKFNSRIHWEQRRGTLKQALDYLNKEDKLEEREIDLVLIIRVQTSFEDHYNDAVNGVVHPDSAMYVRYRMYLDQVANAHRPHMYLMEN